jgi:hypothetical protein
MPLNPEVQTSSQDQTRRSKDEQTSLLQQVQSAHKNYFIRNMINNTFMDHKLYWYERSTK